MRRLFLLSIVSGFVAMAACVYLGSNNSTVLGQTNRVSRTSSSAPLKPIAKYVPAAEANASSLLNLSWTFGKPQTGWVVYVPLISHTIGTHAQPDSADFAAAVAGWQSKHGITATGQINEETLGAFIRQWQSGRLHRGAPLTGELLTAPTSVFFDPSRSPELRQLERGTYDAYRRMISAAAKDLAKTYRFTRAGETAESERFLKIVSAYRSPEYQAELRRKSPGSGTIALAKNSPHSTGRALDLYVGGDPVSTKDANRQIQVETPAYKWLVENAGRFGFVNYFYEPWHWEYVGK